MIRRSASGAGLSESDTLRESAHLGGTRVSVSVFRMSLKPPGSFLPSNATDRLKLFTGWKPLLRSEAR